MSQILDTADVVCGLDRAVIDVSIWQGRAKPSSRQTINDALCRLDTGRPVCFAGSIEAVPLHECRVHTSGEQPPDAYAFGDQRRQMRIFKGTDEAVRVWNEGLEQPELFDFAAAMKAGGVEGIESGQVALEDGKPVMYHGDIAGLISTERRGELDKQRELLSKYRREHGKAMWDELDKRDELAERVRLAAVVAALRARARRAGLRTTIDSGGSVRLYIGAHDQQGTPFDAGDPRAVELFVRLVEQHAATVKSLAA